jgi:aspartate 1-decarboxylase
MLKSKIHRASVTDANLNYVGSVSIDLHLMTEADILENEKVTVLNITNGERFDTYAIVGRPGEITLNGAAARKVQRGDLVIILTYVEMEDADAREHRPRVVFVDAENLVTDIEQAGGDVTEHVPSVTAQRVPA